MELQHNKWVDNLLNLYIGKVDAIGLDSEFARATYIETLLDKELIPAIIQGQYAVVFLTGNPGDGKTSFLEKVCDHLKEKGAIGHKDNTGFSLNYQERVYTACYDGASAHQEQKLSADDWLKQLFAPFKGRQRPNTSHIVLVAINDGKLHSFFHLKEVREEWQWLSKSAIDKAFNPSNQRAEDGVLVVNLKERALVDLEIGQDNPESCLFDQLLLLFTDKQHWEICHQCSEQADCPIFANARSLGFSSFAKQARTRVKLLFLMSHLRRQRHNTMRNIRSALSFAITSNLDCQAIHEASEETRQQWSKRRYFHALFSGQDEILREFVELDPARVNIAHLDRKSY